MRWARHSDRSEEGIPARASRRVPQPETLHEPCLRTSPRKEFLRREAESPLLPGIPHLAHTETPRLRVGPRRPAAASECARAGTASPTRAAAIFAQYARASPPVHSHRSANSFPPSEPSRKFNINRKIPLTTPLGAGHNLRRGRAFFVCQSTDAHDSGSRCAEHSAVHSR